MPVGLLLREPVREVDDDEFFDVEVPCCDDEVRAEVVLCDVDLGVDLAVDLL